MIKTAIEVGSRWRGVKRSGYGKLVATVLSVEGSTVTFSYVTPKRRQYSTLWDIAAFKSLWEPITEEKTCGQVE